MAPSLWGLPVVVTTALTAGTVLCGAFRIGAELYPRMGLTVSMTNSDQDDFIKNLQTLRMESRQAFAVTHPLAFCIVTGIV